MSIAAQRLIKKMSNVDPQSARKVIKEPNLVVAVGRGLRVYAVP